MLNQIMNRNTEWISKNRVEALIDGIFAFSMTILVATVIYPTMLGNVCQPMSLSEMVVQVIPDLLYYAIAFMILTSYWLYHHLHYYLVRRLDLMATKIMLIALFFITLLPVSTTVMAQYSTTPLADILFEVNLFIIGVLFTLHYAYAIRNGHLLDKPLTPVMSCIILRRGLVTPVISLIAIGVSFAGFPMSILLYFLAPAMNWYAEHRCWKKHKQPESCPPIKQG